MHNTPFSQFSLSNTLCMSMLIDSITSLWKIHLKIFGYSSLLTAVIGFKNRQSNHFKDLDISHSIWLTRSWNSLERSLNYIDHPRSVQTRLKWCMNSVAFSPISNQSNFHNHNLNHGFFFYHQFLNYLKEILFVLMYLFLRKVEFWLLIYHHRAC